MFEIRSVYLSFAYKLKQENTLLFSPVAFFVLLYQSNPLHHSSPSPLKLQLL
jgi:hypothetical protein